MISRRMLPWAALLVLTLTTTSRAQFEAAPEPEFGPRFGKEFKTRYQAGMTISAGRSPCKGIVATLPLPSEWPEQQVRVGEEDISPAAKNIRFRDIDGGLRQMIVTVPQLPAGEQAKALITYDITRREILPPENPEEYVLPKRLSLDVRRHLAFSPFIESRHGKIRSQAAEIQKAHADEPAWKQVEAIYNWVRDNITYETTGETKGAVAALRDKKADYEDLTGLFIALCRANDIPARTVWVPEYCYAEFYLEGKDGKGYWFPCRLTGERNFGAEPTGALIVQKGDNFRVPEEKAPQRFVAEFLKGSGGRPSVDFVRQPMPAE